MELKGKKTPQNAWKIKVILVDFFVHLCLLSDSSFNYSQDHISKVLDNLTQVHPKRLFYLYHISICKAQPVGPAF